MSTFSNTLIGSVIVKYSRLIYCIAGNKLTELIFAKFAEINMNLTSSEILLEYNN